MLVNFKLPRSFLVEVVNTTYYLVNRSPLFSICFKTLEEMWSGRPKNFNSFSIFGCPTYAHINQGKLEARALKRVFVDYPNEVKGYRIWYDNLADALTVEILCLMKLQ